MDPHIVRLTDSLIKTHDFFGFYQRIEKRSELIEHIKATLDCSDVKKMGSPKLGEIICEFEACHVEKGREEILNKIVFDGNYEHYLRELVSLCLAHAIIGRIDDSHPADILRWQKKAKRVHRTERRVG